MQIQSRSAKAGVIIFGMCLASPRGPAHAEAATTPAKITQAFCTILDEAAVAYRVAYEKWREETDPYRKDGLAKALPAIRAARDSQMAALVSAAGSSKTPFALKVTRFRHDLRKSSALVVRMELDPMCTTLVDIEGRAVETPTIVAVLKSLQPGDDILVRGTFDAETCPPEAPKPENGDEPNGSANLNSACVPGKPQLDWHSPPNDAAPRALGEPRYQIRIVSIVPNDGR